jgi:hypothetical protein
MDNNEIRNHIFGLTMTLRYAREKLRAVSGVDTDDFSTDELMEMSDAIVSEVVEYISNYGEWAGSDGRG